MSWALRLTLGLGVLSAATLAFALKSGCFVWLPQEPHPSHTLHAEYSPRQSNPQIHTVFTDSHPCSAPRITFVAAVIASYFWASGMVGGGES
eukprot:4073846-Pleurochrysis_carterae.AAC.1